MTSNYQDVRDDAREARDILARRSKLTNVPTGPLPDVVRYTIRPTLSVATDAEGLPVILTFDGEDLISFDNPRHAMNALLTLSVVPFIGTEDATTALLDSDAFPYPFHGENRADAVRAAALWSAEYGRMDDTMQFHILWDDDQDDNATSSTLMAD